MATSPISTATSFPAGTPPTIGPSPWTAAIPRRNGKGLLTVDETPHLLNPKSGWLYNTNNWPWSAAGPSSPKKEDYPAYVENGGESARGLHAIRVLENKKDFTLDSLIAAAFDSYLTWFEKPMPALIKAWDAAPDANPLKAKPPRRSRSSANGICAGRSTPSPPPWPFSGAKTCAAGRAAGAEAHRPRTHAGRTDAAIPGRGIRQTDRRFRNVEDAMGRHQPIPAPHRRHRPALQRRGPEHSRRVHLGAWGSLASFGARAYPGTKKWYGTSGNSFVAVVEFGERVRAKAVTAGGESGHPASPHFNDEAQRYSAGDLREVYFYRDQLKGHTEREYHPGN